MAGIDSTGSIGNLNLRRCCWQGVVVFVKLFLYAVYYMDNSSEFSKGEEAEKKIDMQRLQNLYV